MLSEQEIRHDILKNFPQWSQFSPESIRVQKMTGITNLTYKAEIIGASNVQPIIYRRFGQSNQSKEYRYADIFLSRIEQIQIYRTLSESGDGPKIYYFDEKIRLEEFIESSVLEAKNMLVPGYLEEVAYTLTHFHHIKPKSENISDYNLIRKTFINKKAKMLQICHEKLKKDIYTPEQQKEIEIFKTWVSADEIEFVASVISKYEKEPLVFSHNDLLANNVLIRKDNGKFVFIDYEYCSFNFPIYDIANYFEESQIDYDVTEAPYFAILPQKPQDQEMKVRFIDAYVIGQYLPHEEFKTTFEALRKEPKNIEKREKLMSDLVVGRMLCSLTWGWWAIIVSKNPHINFDYIKFARMRYDNYYQCKKSLMK